MNIFKNEFQKPILQKLFYFMLKEIIQKIVINIDKFCYKIENYSFVIGNNLTVIILF